MSLSLCWNPVVFRGGLLAARNADILNLLHLQKCRQRKSRQFQSTDNCKGRITARLSVGLLTGQSRASSENQSKGLFMPRKVLSKQNSGRRSSMKPSTIRFDLEWWNHLGCWLCSIVLFCFLFVPDSKALPSFRYDLNVGTCFVDITKTLRHETWTGRHPQSDITDDNAEYDVYHCECRISQFPPAATNLVLGDLANLDSREHNFKHHFLFRESVYCPDNLGLGWSAWVSGHGDSWIWADSWNYLLVTGVESHAFKDKTKLQHVRLPDTCRNIGDYAFEGCTSLTSIELQEGLESIGDYAFYGCSALTNIVIPNSVTNIGEFAFEGCTSLASITLGTGIKHIREGFFENCSSLKDIVIPNGVTSIDDNVFCGCHFLGDIVIPDSVTNIGRSAFYDCSASSITLGNGITELPCFSDTEVASITIGHGIATIPSRVFENCTSLEKVVIPDSVRQPLQVLRKPLLPLRLLPPLPRLQLRA